MELQEDTRISTELQRMVADCARGWLSDMEEVMKETYDST